MIKSLENLIDTLKQAILNYKIFDLFIKTETKDYHFSINENSLEALAEIITVLPNKGRIVISRINNDVRSQNAITQILDIIDYDFLNLPEIKKDNTEISIFEKFMTRQLDWYIEQSQKNEERLDRRLKEIMKSANVTQEIDAQKIDFSGLIPHLMPVLEVLKNLGNK